MDSSAYIFVPKNCASGTVCKLVVALHGCEQGQESSAYNPDGCWAGGAQTSAI
jgi:poly(3-hydroxybutyrate) depolymerase